MSIDERIFNAILALDSYNHGYDSIIQLSTVLNSTKIGTATIVTATRDDNNAARDIGFYAITYDNDTNGDGVSDETIISYRGTDYPNENGNVFYIVPKDSYYGWFLGGGFTTSLQGRMAVDYYNTIVDEKYGTVIQANDQNIEISLTGHSLGGGLSGFIGALYDQDAKVFDSMSFIFAAGAVGLDSTLKQKIYGSQNMWPTDFTGIEGYYVEGEVLDTMLPFRDVLGTTAELYPYDLGTDVSLPDSIFPLDVGTKLHSMTSMVIRLFADYGTNADGSLIASYWDSAAEYFWPILYDNSFAQSIGMNDVSLSGEARTKGEFDGILRTIIAYSAIEHIEENNVVISQSVFGDTAIRAFYDDANDLGATISSNTTKSGNGGIVQTYATDISKAFIQFAGLLALNKIISADEFIDANTSATDGVVTFDGLSLTVNFSDELWTAAGGGTLPAMVARDEMVNHFFASSGIEAQIRSGMLSVWGDNTANVIEKVIFLLDGQGNTIIPDHNDAADKGVMVIGSAQGDAVTGSNDNDLVFGGEGQDVIRTAGGSDILYGDGGDDILVIATPVAGEVIHVHGGSGEDRAAIYASQTNFTLSTGASGETVLTHNSNGAEIHVFDDVEEIHFQQTSTYAFAGAGTHNYNMGYFDDNYPSLSESPEFFATYEGEDAGTGTGSGPPAKFSSKADLASGSVFLEWYDAGNTTIDARVAAAFRDFLTVNVAGANSNTVTNITFRYSLSVAGDTSGTLFGNPIYDKIQGAGYRLSDNLYYQGQPVGNVDGGTPPPFTDLNNSDNTIGEVTYQFYGPQTTILLGYGLAINSVGTVGTPTFGSVIGSVEIVNVAPGVTITSESGLFGTKSAGDEPLLVAGTDLANDIIGSWRKDYIQSEGGNDTITTGLADDRIAAGAGNDSVNGGDGVDEAVFKGVYANYTINGNTVTDNVGTDGTDTLTSIERLIFADGVYENGVFTPVTDDDNFIATSAAETFDGDVGIDKVDFSNSNAAVTIDLQSNTASGGFAAGDIFIEIENITGSTYDDTVNGDTSNNTITGGNGIDTLRGKDGSDVLFGDLGNDYLRGDNGNDYVYGGDGVDKLRGGDGNDVIYGGAGNDQDVNAEVGNDTLYGEDGDDKLRGGVDNDALFGGNGNDLLYGDTDDLDTTGGNDTIDGGAGNDSLRGGHGNDAYFASVGTDDIYDLGGMDTIVYGSGVAIQDITITSVSGDANDIAIVLGADQILIENQLEASGNLMIEKLVFWDSSVATLARVANWIDTPLAGGTTTGLSVADTIIGDAGNDTINGLAGNDELFGAGGDDSLRGGEGDDQLHGGDGFNAALFSGVYSNYVFAGNTIDDTVGNDGTDTFFNIQRFKFFDGTYENGVFTPSSTNDTLTATAAADVLDGGAGSDTADYSGSNAAVSIDLLNGTASSGYARGDSLLSIENLIGSAYGDTLADGIGNSALSGGLGGDTYIYRGGLDAVTDTGGADTMVLANASVQSTTFVFSGNDLVITVNAGTNEVRITNQALTASAIETIRFADGFEATLTALNSWVFSSTSVHGSNGVDDTIILGSADHTSYGYSGNDRIHGGAGNDILRGNEGTDMVFGGTGNDDLQGNDGNDVVDGGDGVDKLRGGLGNDVLNAGAGDDTDVRAEDGDDTVYGGDGNDTLYGDLNSTDTITGHDTLDGGAGNDSLYGGLGNDTYLASNGADYVNDRGGADAIRFGAGISLFSLSFAGDPVDTNDQIITFGANTIAVENQTESSGAYTVETLLFADGTYANFANILDWDFATIGGGTIHGSYTEDDTMVGNIGADSFYGKDGNDQLFGGAGNDYLRGDSGNDLLVGGAGNDDMKGDGGDDKLYAGAGADRLEGMAGADSYIFQGAEIVDGNLNRIVGFSQADNDFLILDDVLQGFDPVTDAIADFITLSTTSHTYLSIDVDGKGEAFNMMADVIRLENITVWSSVSDMITQGDLVVT